MSATTNTSVGGQVQWRSDSSVIAYLAYLGILLAVGIDISLPAFDELDVAFDRFAPTLEVLLVARCWRR